MENQTYLEKICQEIYAKHQKALDLIFEYRLDRVSEVNEIVLKWIETKKDEINYVPIGYSKSKIHYTTQAMSEIFPDAEKPTSRWGTRNYYFYEIDLNGDGYGLNIHLKLDQTNIPSNLKEILNKIIELSPKKKKPKENWKRYVASDLKWSGIDEELSEEKIFKQLDEYFKKIKKFESQLVEKFKQDLPQ